MLRLRPESIAHTGLDSTCPTCSLSCTSLGYSLSIESRHPTTRIEAWNPLKTGIEHDPHTVDGDTGLSDVCGQHNLPLSCRCRINRSPLLTQIELTMKGAKKNVTLK
ncbi:hypothetical protein PPUJ20188_55320 [Pseudomonas putida]|nr:hypothetical protein PPUJ20188_55320 [Pseudomonas putida]